MRNNKEFYQSLQPKSTTPSRPKSGKPCCHPAPNEQTVGYIRGHYSYWTIQETLRQNAKRKSSHQNRRFIHKRYPVSFPAPTPVITDPTPELPVPPPLIPRRSTRISLTTQHTWQRTQGGCQAPLNTCHRSLEGRCGNTE